MRLLWIQVRYRNRLQHLRLAKLLNKGHSQTFLVLVLPEDLILHYLLHRNRPLHRTNITKIRITPLQHSMADLIHQHLETTT